MCASFCLETKDCIAIKYDATNRKCEYGTLVHSPGSSFQGYFDEERYYDSVYVPPPEMSWLITIDPYGSWGQTDIVELTGQGRTCPTIGLHPEGRGKKAVFMDGRVIICGTSNCYDLDRSSMTWNNIGVLPRYMKYLGGVQFSDVEFWISGGHESHSTSYLFNVRTGVTKGSDTDT